MTKLGLAALAAASITLGTLPRQHLPATPPSPAQESAEAAIRAVQAQMRAAANRLDAEALYAFVLDTDVPPIIENGKLQPTRASALQSTARGFRAFASVSYAYTREHVTLLSPTAALWVGEGRATATLTDGRQVTAPFAETIVLERRDGAWKVLHAHRSTPGAGG